ncbi:MAG: glycosyltransferase family 9 protein [Phycisphaerae bacterium]|nr:glycosyltransferase family 9 protein [Phycisphaerae bacterium]
MGNGYKNILIIKPSAMGDIVHALPVLGALRAAVPGARITWLVRREFAPLLECFDGLDEILLFDRKLLGHWYYRPAAFKALFGFMQTLRRHDYDLVLDLQGLFRTALFGYMTRCPRRVGMADSRELAGLFYTQKVSRPEYSVHVLDYYHALLKGVGIDSLPATETFFKVSNEAVASVKQKLEQAGISRKYLVLAPSSAHPSKCWPAERFAKLVEYLNRQFDLAVVVIGASKDRPVIDAIKAHCNIPLVDLVGKTTIVELIALLQGARGVVSNDTGPGHIAAAMHIPTVLIFGHTNPMRVGPYQRPECVAAIEPDQRPPFIESPDPSHRIEHVPFELVLDKITMQLKNGCNESN